VLHDMCIWQAAAPSWPSVQPPVCRAQLAANMPCITIKADNRTRSGILTVNFDAPGCRLFNRPCPVSLATEARLDSR
jgi:hypothetical protein